MAAEPAVLRSGIRDFNLSDADFERVRDLIHRHAGIALGAGKRQMVYSRLSRRLRTHGLMDFADYLKLLETGEGGELRAFTNALTTNITSFFRERHHFPILADHAKRCGTRPLTIWSSACSTGEEAYSIAITVAETFESMKPPVRILASDVDTNVLEKARFGAYPIERIGKMPGEQAAQFFLRGSGAHEGMVRVRPELRRMISFRQINLLEPNWQVHGPLDAIFCRNVMIYFDRKTQYEILKRFASVLGPGGLLFVGHSESLQHASDLFRLQEKTVYHLAAAKRVPEHA